MCGINGYTIPSKDAPVNPLTIEAMNRALAHRGPDGEGRLIHGCLAMGMRRLAIIDVEHGQQPIVTADERYAIVYNGELYDYRNTREALLKRGLTFQTHTDTEVILKAFVADGLDALSDFNGMFAFAISDAKDNSVVLVRDQIGIKPLYYYHGDDGTLVFSSELSSLLAHPLVPRELDHDSLAMLVADRSVGDPYTLLRNVRQLPAGHWLRWRDGNIEVRSYYHAVPGEAPFAVSMSADEPSMIDGLRTRLEETVTSQLVADVPVATFLSGGIDSSTVAAYAARAIGDKLHTFSVSFANPSYDESLVARQVADHIGSTHHELRVESSGFDQDLMQRIVSHLGQPIQDVSSIPMLLVSDYASNYVKVVLSGDGGDEYFGGYSYLHWAKQIADVRARFPEWSRRSAHSLARALARVTRGALTSRLRRVHKGLALTLDSPDDMMRQLLGQMSRDEMKELLIAPPEKLRPPTSLAIADPERVEFMEYAMDYMAKTKMIGAFMPKVDRMSMAASLEVRVPLLDRRITEYALRLPLHMKVRGKVGKYALREAGRPLLPDAVYSHPKQGFVPVLEEWFNAKFWNAFGDISGPGSDLAQLFRREALDELVAAGSDSGKALSRVSFYGSAGRAWLLVQLDYWLRAFRVSI